MFEYTGHPYIDLGIATITAFAGKQNPTAITESDLEKIADYITREYIRQPLRSFLTVVFPNSGFTQPAFFKQPDRQLDYARRVLRSYSTNIDTLEETCVFTGKPATAIAFSDKDNYPLGRAFRQHIPLLTGESIINFSPYGDSGVPVSGEALLAIQAFPLGCAKSEGKILAVHSDNSELILHFASTFLEINRKQVQIAQQSGAKKMPESHLKYKTLFINVLLEAETMRRDASRDEQPFSITAYHLSNSGQGPALDIYHLPMQIIGFLREMEKDPYRTEWHPLVARAWERASKKKGKKKSSVPFQPSRNFLYEDLFQLPESFKKFIRAYFLPTAIKYARDKSGKQSQPTEIQLVSWQITARFLRRILNMDQERVEQIRVMGDRLAEYVNAENDRRFFRQFYTLQRYDYLRNALIKANLACVRRGHAPLITLDPYLDVFEEGNELARRDWRLARDLVLIRMVERLHEMGWLDKNTDIIEEADAAEEETVSS